MIIISNYFKPSVFQTLHEKCPYSELFWSFFAHFPAFGMNISLNAGKCRKNADQNNPEYGHFLHSDIQIISNFSKLLSSIF